MSATDLVFDIFAIDRASAVFSRVGREAEAAGAAVERGSKAMNAAILGAGAIAVGFGVKAVEMAGNFQMSMSKLTTTAGEIPSNMALVSSGIEQMAGKVGYTVQDLANAMYYVESGGYHGATGLKVLTAAAEAARIEGSNVTDTAHALTGALNDYHGTTLTATEATNAMTAAVGHGMMTFQDLAEAMPRIGARAAAAHVSFQEMLAALGTMTKDGLPASVAATYLGQSIGQLAAPTAKARAEMKALGINATEVAATITSGSGHGLGDAIQLLYDGIHNHLVRGGLLSSSAFKEMASSTTGYQKILANLPPTVQTSVQALATMAGGVRSFQGVLMLGGAHADQYRETLKAVTDQVSKGGTQVAGWQQIQGNFNQKLAEAKGAASALAVEFGTDLMPAASGLIGGIQSLTGFMAQNQQLFIDLGTAAVVAGGSLLVLEGAAKAVAIAEGIAAMASEGFGASEVFLNLQLAATAFATEGAASGFAFLGAAMEATPFGLIAVGIGGAVAGIMALSGSFGHAAAADEAFKHAMDQVDQATGPSAGHIQSLASTYDHLKGSVTAATYAMVEQDLERSGALKAAQRLGISEFTLASASLGNAAAIKLVNQHLAEWRARSDEAAAAAARAKKAMQTTATDPSKGVAAQQAARDAGDLAAKYAALQQSIQLVQKAYGGESTSVKAASDSWKQAELAASYAAGAFDNLRNKVEFMNAPIAHTQRQVAELAAVFHLSAAQIQTVMRDEMVGGTVTGVQKIVAAIEAAKGGVHAAAVDLGLQLAAGAKDGILSSAFTVAQAAANMVDQAVAAAKKAGKIQSPSRVFAEIGVNLVDGLVVGMTDNSSKAARAAEAAVKHAAAAAHRATMQSLHVAELQLGYALSDSKTALSEINKEVTTAQQWASSFKDNVFTAQLTMPTAWETLRIGGMNVRAQTGGGALPANASSAQTFAAMMSYEQMKAAQNANLASDIRSLRAKGLSQLALDDIKGSGPNSLAEISALAHATKAQIAAFNKLEAANQNSLYNAGAYATAGTSYSTLLRRQESREDITAAIEKALRGVKFTIANGGKTMRATG